MACTLSRVWLAWASEEKSPVTSCKLSSLEPAPVRVFRRSVSLSWLRETATTLAPSARNLWTMPEPTWPVAPRTTTTLFAAAISIFASEQKRGEGVYLWLRSSEERNADGAIAIEVSPGMQQQPTHPFHPSIIHLSAYFIDWSYERQIKVRSYGLVSIPKCIVLTFPNSLELLPKDVLRIIFSYTTGQTLAKLTCCNKSFQALCSVIFNFAITNIGFSWTKREGFIFISTSLGWWALEATRFQNILRKKFSRTRKCTIKYMEGNNALFVVANTIWCVGM